MKPFQWHLLFAGSIIGGCAISAWALGIPWLSGAVPALAAIALLDLIPQVYSYFRAKHWEGRKLEERRTAQEELNIPTGVKKPEEFEGVDLLHQAQHSELPKTPDYQGRYRSAGVLVAFLPPLAVLFLTLQGLFWTNGGPFAVGLVIAEAVLLAWLIHLVWTNRDPAEPWLRSRVRAELLRREQYLRLAMVGPYLGLSGQQALATAEARRSTIMNGDLPTLKTLIVMATLGGRDWEGDEAWLNALWQHDNPPLLPELLERMQCFLHNRVRKQMVWYTVAEHDNECSETLMSRLVKGAVIFAFGAAVAHASLLWDQGEQGVARHLGVGGPVLITLAAYVLPVVSAALLGLQHLFAFRPLAVIYRDSRRELLTIQANLNRMLVVQMRETADHDRGSCQRSFQALVLRTEQVLTDEMKKWMVLVDRREHEMA